MATVKLWSPNARVLIVINERTACKENVRIRSNRRFINFVPSLRAMKFLRMAQAIPIDKWAQRKSST